jgi:hypothetical protein
MPWKMPSKMNKSRLTAPGSDPQRNHELHREGSGVPVADEASPVRKSAQEFDLTSIL